MVTGYWFEAGVATTTNNYGQFKLTLAEDGTWFRGTWSYASVQGEPSSPPYANTWAEKRVNASRPDDSSCWWSATPAQPGGWHNAPAAPPSHTASQIATYEPLLALLYPGALTGTWQVTEGDPPAIFELCVNTRADYIVGSYNYTLDASVVQAYESGRCFLGGTLCTGLFFEDNGVFGVFMTYLVAPGEARDVWW